MRHGCGLLGTLPRRWRPSAFYTGFDGPSRASRGLPQGCRGTYVSRTDTRLLCRRGSVEQSSDRSDILGRAAISERLGRLHPAPRRLSDTSGVAQRQTEVAQRLTFAVAVPGLPEDAGGLLVGGDRLVEAPHFGQGKALVSVWPSLWRSPVSR